MRDDGKALEPEQVGAAVGVRIEPAPQSVRRRTDHERPRLAALRLDDLLPKAVEDAPDRPLEDLQPHVPCEAVAHDDVGAALEQLPPLHVPDEADVLVLGEQPVSLADEPVSLLRFLADRQESDLGVADADDLPREDRAHVRELEQVLGPRVRVRAGVDEHGHAAHRGKRRGDRGPAHVRKPADLEQARRQHRARVPRRHDGADVAPRRGSAGGEERAVALVTGGVRRLLVHPDDLRRVDDLEVGRERLDLLARPEQDRLDVGRHRFTRARDHLARRVIAAHRVDGDSNTHVRRPPRVQASRAARLRDPDTCRRSGRRDEGAWAGGTAGTRRAPGAEACAAHGACRGALSTSFAWGQP